MSSVLFAIHLPDNVIANPWCVGGFVGMGLMLVLGAWRIRDEEIPRVALLTAVFFVASQIHVPLPGSTAHLLLNGLVGVILGRRAGLAIPIGLFLQMALFQHGGWTTLGVNSCVMGLPALVAWGIFAGLRSAPFLQRPWFGSALVALSVFIFAISLAYASNLMVMNSPAQEELDFRWANTVTFHPLTITAALGLGLVAIWVERRMCHAPEFPLGLLVGELSVLATVLLNSVALLFGAINPAGTRTPALILCIVYLPLAVIEGAVVGFLVGFLVRVKPEMLGWHEESANKKEKRNPEPAKIAMLLAPLTVVLGSSSFAYAHRLKTDFTVTEPKTVQVESFFDTGGWPKSATVKVLRPDGQTLAEGKMDKNAIFIFTFEKAETLKVIVSAEDGHHSELEIPAAALDAGDAPQRTEATAPTQRPLLDRDSPVPIKDTLLGITFLLALAAFVLALRNAHRLRRFSRDAESSERSAGPAGQR